MLGMSCSNTGGMRVREGLNRMEMGTLSSATVSRIIHLGRYWRVGHGVVG